MKIPRVVCLAFSAFALVQAAIAESITISGYDITDAAFSGFGFWGHSYDGTTTSEGNFTWGNFAGYDYGTYSGGGGTLNNGVIETNIQTTQLFFNGTSTDGVTLSPTIFLNLPDLFTIDSIDLFGGTFSNNALPGQITGLTVELVGSGGSSGPVAFTTTDFGILNSLGVPVNDNLDLTGSLLDGFAANLVILSNFQHPQYQTNPNNYQYFSLAEIQLDGQVAPVPEPATLVLVGLGLTFVATRRLSRRR